jgi:hypothetical protein
MRALILVFLVACGGGASDVEGDPLIQSTLMNQYNNREWTALYGFGRSETKNNETKFIMFLGSSKISCADSFDGVPRFGTYAVTSIANPPVVGSSSAFFSLTDVKSNGDLEGKGSGGMVQMTAVNELDVSAVFSYDMTFDGGRYSVNGAVTMLRCP